MDLEAYVCASEGVGSLESLDLPAPLFQHRQVCFYFGAFPVTEAPPPRITSEDVLSALKAAHAQVEAAVKEAEAQLGAPPKKLTKKQCAAALDALHDVSTMP